jgi:outer membrane protein assembly factor BamB
LLAPSDGAVVGIEDATLPVRLNATDVLGVERITARLEVSGGFQEKTCTPPAGPDAVCVMEPTGLGLKVAAGGGADGAISVTVRDKAGHETQVRRKLRLNTRLKWRFVAGSRISWAAAPLAGGKVAVGTDTDGAKVFVVDPQGTQVCVWDAGKASTGNPDGVATPPTPSADGTRFFFATVERLVSLGVDCAVKWTVSGGTYTGSQPAYAEKSDVVFVGRDGDANTPPTLRAHRGANGNLLQSVDLGGAESKNKGATSSPALSPDGSVVYVGAPDANLYAFKVNPSGTLLLTPLWKYTTGTEIGTRPLVTDQRVYVASGSFLHACDRATGTKVSDFTFKAEAPIYSSPVLSRDGATLYIGSLDESLYALDPQSGKEVGKSKVGRMMFTSPAVGEGGMVYAASTPEPGRLYGLSLTLETRWFIDPEQANQFRASPILVGNVLYLGNYNGSLYAVDVTPPAS